MAEWDATVEELCLEACRNLLKEGITICQIESILDIIQEENPDEEGSPLYVMTAKHKYLGASTILLQNFLYPFAAKRNVAQIYLYNSTTEKITDLDEEDRFFRCFNAKEY